MSYIQPHPDFYHSELNLDFSAHSARDGCGGGGGAGGGASIARQAIQKSMQKTQTILPL